MAGRWDAEIRRAQRALERNRAAIEASPRGTPGAKTSDYRRGRGPGASREVRR